MESPFPYLLELLVGLSFWPGPRIRIEAVAARWQGRGRRAYFVKAIVTASQSAPGGSAAKRSMRVS